MGAIFSNRSLLQWPEFATSSRAASASCNRIIFAVRVDGRQSQMSAITTAGFAQTCYVACRRSPGSLDSRLESLRLCCFMGGRNKGPRQQKKPKLVNVRRSSVRNRRSRRILLLLSVSRLSTKNSVRCNRSRTKVWPPVYPRPRKRCGSSPALSLEMILSIYALSGNGYSSPERQTRAAIYNQSMIRLNMCRVSCSVRVLSLTEHRALLCFCQLIDGQHGVPLCGACSTVAFMRRFVYFRLFFVHVRYSQHR